MIIPNHDHERDHHHRHRHHDRRCLQHHHLVCASACLQKGMSRQYAHSITTVPPNYFSFYPFSFSTFNFLSLSITLANHCSAKFFQFYLFHFHFLLTLYHCGQPLCHLFLPVFRISFFHFHFLVCILFPFTFPVTLYQIMVSSHVTHISTFLHTLTFLPIQGSQS